VEFRDEKRYDELALLAVGGAYCRGKWDMENHGILKWCRWSRIAKGLVLGAFAGIACLVLMPWVFNVERVGVMVAAAMALIISFPAWLIFHVFGWEEPFGSGHKPTMAFTVAVYATIILLFALLGGLVQAFRGKRQKPSPNCRASARAARQDQAHE
jgi:hypothetical protein